MPLDPQKKQVNIPCVTAGKMQLNFPLYECQSISPKLPKHVRLSLLPDELAIGEKTT